MLLLLATCAPALLHRCISVATYVEEEIRTPMAKAFEDSDVWLPDGVPGDKGGGDGKVGRKDCFPIEFPFEFAANLDSPVESVTETEASDEDGEDYVAGLTKQMARYFLQDEDEVVAADAAEVNSQSPFFFLRDF